MSAVTYSWKSLIEDNDITFDYLDSKVIECDHGKIEYNVKEQEYSRCSLKSYLFLLGKYIHKFAVSSSTQMIE